MNSQCKTPPDAPPREALTRAAGRSQDELDAAVRIAAQGKHAEAEGLFLQLLLREPENAFAAHQFAVFLSRAERLDEARRYYDLALRLRPDYMEAWRNLGNLHRTQHQWADACESLWKALRLRPNDIRTIRMLADCLLSGKRREEAIPLLQHGLRISREDPELWNQLGLVLFDAGRLEEAKDALLESLRHDPRYVSAHNNLASVHKAMGHGDEGMAEFQIALALDPASAKTRWNRSLAMLQAGDFAQGWHEYRFRWQIGQMRRLESALPLWQGEPLTGKRLLLHAEQGLGDTIQFIRYAELVKAAGAHVLFQCPHPLATLLQRAPGIDEVILEGDPLPPYDFHAPLLDLPLRFATRVETIPRQVPYLVPDPARVSQWKNYLDATILCSKRRVGVLWQGNPHHQWDHFRSFALDMLEPLAEIAGIQLVSLQQGLGTEQIHRFQKLTGGALLVPDSCGGAALSDLAETAALMAGLDLVLSVDTAPAHVAGALGLPVWTLISSISDWRWMIDRQDTPWYPTMRLFRQRALNDWAGVLQQVARELASGEAFANCPTTGRIASASLSPASACPTRSANPTD